MFSLNRVSIIGYQTQPVDVRTTPSGTSVTDLNLVVPYSFTKADGTTEQGKSFFTVTVWGSMADVAGQYVRPGSQLYVSGRLQTDSWDDQQTGEKKSKTKVVALDLIMLDPKDGQLAAPQGAKHVTSSVNTAEVVGNLTRDPEIRTTTSGQQVVNLGIATNERWKGKEGGDMNERTEFHSVVIWGELAEEVGKTLRKGNRVYVSGRVQSRAWETREGSKRVSTEIVAEHVSMLGIQNPAAHESIRTEGYSAPAPMQHTGGVASENMPAAEAPAASADQSEPEVAVPAVQYSSDIKAEDLPF